MNHGTLHTCALAAWRGLVAAAGFALDVVIGAGIALLFVSAVLLACAALGCRGPQSPVVATPAGPVPAAVAPAAAAAEGWAAKWLSGLAHAGEVNQAQLEAERKLSKREQAQEDMRRHARGMNTLGGTLMALAVVSLVLVVLVRAFTIGWLGFAKLVPVWTPAAFAAGALVSWQVSYELTVYGVVLAEALVWIQLAIGAIAAAPLVVAVVRWSHDRLGKRLIGKGHLDAGVAIRGAARGWDAATRKVQLMGAQETAAKAAGGGR